MKSTKIKLIFSLSSINEKFAGKQTMISYITFNS
jgi:hypothetical protein